MKEYDAAVIGGGAGGLMAAAQLAKRGFGVLILEKQDRVGKKLLSTGNGRCNLSNETLSESCYFGDSLPKSFFDKYTPERLKNEFLKLGLLTRADGEGRIYPYSRNAASVLDVLRKACESADTVCGAEVLNIEKSGSGFVLKTQSESFCAKNVILACGGRAAVNGFGGYALCEKLSHTVLPLTPALCALTVKGGAKALRGVRAFGEVRLLSGGETIKAERGEIQFTDDALSGICIFNLSPFAKKGSVLSIDLFPEYDQNALFSLCKSTGEKHLPESFLNKILYREALKSYKALHGETRGLSGEIAALKNFSFEITGTRGFSAAQVTGGGIPLCEIDTESFESKKQKGVYILGEMLAVHGLCGGYNLHLAFCSALCACEKINGTVWNKND